MKRSPLILLLSSLLILSLLFSACAAEQGPPNGDDTAQQDPSVIPEVSYDAMIRELENQILELQQSQYITDAETQKELSELQELLAELKEKVPATSPDGGSDQGQNSSQEGTPSPALYSYTRSGESTITVTGYSGEDERLSIPTMIDGYTVTEISDSAFASAKIKSVVIPEGVVKVGWFAFSGCTALESVTIPASVTGIGYSAFPSKTSPVTIYCPKDSFAQKYAQSYGLSYVII